MEAQRFPDDYDGILAGAPAYYWTNMVSAGMQKVKFITRDAASYIPPAKIPAIAAAVNAACDAADGIKDGIIDDPRRCNFKAESLLCKSGDADSCLTQPQVESLKTIYAPVLNAAGKQIYPGTLPGGEEGGGGWGLWLLGKSPEKTLSYAFTTGYFKDMVYSNPQWDYKSFNLNAGRRRIQMLIPSFASSWCPGCSIAPAVRGRAASASSGIVPAPALTIRSTTSTWVWSNGLKKVWRHNR
jgi:feruloyl esterase